MGTGVGGADVIGKLSREAWNERVTVPWSGGTGWKPNTTTKVIWGHADDAVKGPCFLAVGKVN